VGRELPAPPSVQEILEGWHVENGYMWPYVLAAYLLSPLLVGLLLT